MVSLFFFFFFVRHPISEGKKASLPPTGPAALEPAARAALYVKGMFGNVCGVVLWKGLENVRSRACDPRTLMLCADVWNISREYQP